VLHAPCFFSSRVAACSQAARLPAGVSNARLEACPAECPLSRRARAQDYDLASFQSGAIVDRGATGFAHVAMYRAGHFEMEQARAAAARGT